MKKSILFLTLLVSVGVLAQKKVKLEDNSNATNFYFLSGKVGLGSSNPKSMLQVSGGSNNWNESIQGLATGSIHLDPENATNNFGNAITFGASDSGNGENAQAGIYVRSDGTYGTKMYFSTTDAYIAGSKTAMTIDHKGKIGIGTNSPKSKLQVSGGSSNWSESIQGLATGSIHLDPENATNNFGNAITFGASDTGNGENAQAGIYVRSDGSYGTKMYFSTTDAYIAGSKTAMTIDHKGKIGIGTNTPKSKLQISGGSNNWNESIQGLATGSIHLDPENTTNNFGNAITFGASDSGNGENAQAGIYVRSDGAYGTKMYFSTTDAYVTGSKTAMSIDHKGKIGIGTETTGSHRLAVQGSIGAREILVEASGWSDFVFEKKYQLPSLEEVEDHINTKGHLKDIPSAKEVEKNGILLGQMDAKLLQKIEELTLYTIQQEKRIKILESNNQNLEKENKQLHSLSQRLNEIEKLLKTNK
ncbi:hypothetical protein AWE51_18630 [Aquimarina aggregata]|uniref:Peptidase S74 domain-containing protein n=1 Tax=Aquimarina aggregata TaxID=1642818 RepID=A0A162WFN3_9FLAO|nr:hypothetical protein [Aquimarina aggregata]KZS38063.1 hypothetical protein AWE51_18630 [Aquimarina aggregata]